MTARTTAVWGLAFGLLAALAAGCGPQRAESEAADTGTTGGIRVQVVWPAVPQRIAGHAQITPLSAPAGVATMRFLVSGPGMATLQQDFAASAGTGTIGGIPIGDNRTLTIRALDGGGAVLYEGTTSGIQVQADIAVPVAVTMAAQGSAPAWAPMGLKAIAGDQYVALSWSPVAGATTYTVYWGTSPGVTPATGTAITGITGTSRIHSFLTNGTPYYYVVTYTAASGESGTYDELSVTPAPPRISGWNHSLYRRDNGTLWAWGENFDGQLGLGAGSATYQPTPTQVGTDTDWVTAAAGGYHSVALKSNGTLWAWGSNDLGQVGDNSGVTQPSPVQVGSANTWKAIAAGGHHSVAVKADGTAWAWGWGSYGELGTGTTGISSPTPIQVCDVGQIAGCSQFLMSVVAVAAGFNHSVALKADGTVWAWGFNGSGQLGDGTSSPHTTPVQVCAIWQASACSQYLLNIVAIAAGYSHTLALRNDGTLWAWGQNLSGQMGDGSGGNQIIPVQVGGTTNWALPVGGSAHSLALRADGTLWAWGSATVGQLGIGPAQNQLSPVQVGSGTDWSAIASGYDHTLALKSDGTLWSWGQDDVGQLGNTVVGDKLSPLRIESASSWLSASAGGGHSFGRKADGGYSMWGANNSGQLGDGTVVFKQTPVLIGTSGTWDLVLGSTNFSFGMKSGLLYAWGANTSGQLGDNSGVDQHAPVQVCASAAGQPPAACTSFIANVTAVATGTSHVVALLNDGTVWAWGSGADGQLGNGFNLSSPLPVQESSQSTNWTAIAAGQRYTVALKSDGTVWAWGSNSYGQLGDGTSTSRTTPVQVCASGATAPCSKANGNALSGITAIDARTHHVVALKSGGNVWTWGYNYYGQLGDGTTTDRWTPVQVCTAYSNGNCTAWLGNIDLVAAGGSHSVAKRTISNSHQLWAWGQNQSGQLGIGSRADQSLAAQVGTVTSWVSVDAGGTHTLGVQTNGSLWVWGDNSGGQLGDGTAWADTPQQVTLP